MTNQALTIIIQALYIFLDTIKFLIFIDIILSWLTLLWINLRFKFIRDLINPIYNYIKRIIPTSIWYIDFAPIIILIILELLKYALFIAFPDIVIQLN